MILRTLPPAMALAVALAAFAVPAFAQSEEPEVILANVGQSSWSFAAGAGTDNRSKGLSKSDGDAYAWGQAEWTSASGLFYAGPAFVTRFRAAYKDDPVWAAHYAYDAVHVLADAIRTADGVNGKALRARLHAIDATAPVTSTMRFTADGESPHGAISVYQRKDGRWDALMRSEKW